MPLFFKLLVVVSAAMLLTACNQENTPATPPAGTANAQAAATQQVYTLRLAESWPENFPLLGDANRNMKAMAEKMSNGRLQIQIDSKNKHKAPLQIFDLVRNGLYDMGHSSTYYWKGEDPNMLFFTTMPFGMTSMEQYAWFYHGGGMQLMAEVFDPYGVKVFPGGNTGNQMGGWFQKEIRTVEDFKGLKLRYPGFAGEVLAELGAKPTNIPAGELYIALERGTIDALEWVGPSLDLRMGFHKIAPYYYSGWHEPGAEIVFLINDKAWEELPADLQEILRVAMRSAAYDMYAQSEYMSAENLATMKQDYPNIETRIFPPTVIRAMREANEKLLAKLAQHSPLTKKIIDAQAAYLNQVREWTKISDYSYLKSNASER